MKLSIVTLSAGLIRMITIMIILIFLVVACRYWHLLWLTCKYKPDSGYLVVNKDILVKAGNRSIVLPKNLVLYPASEEEIEMINCSNELFKIYVYLNTDASDLTSLWELNGKSNLFHRLER